MAAFYGEFVKLISDVSNFSRTRLTLAKDHT